jgi:hypothetical protein
MALPLIGAAIVGGANLVGGLLGEWWASSADDERQALIDEAARLYGDISPPTLEKVLAEKAGVSATEGIPRDFGNLTARNRAIQAIIDEGLAGGNTLQSQLELEQARRATAAQETQGRAALMQQARARGLGGNAALLGQMQAQQAGADRLSMAGLQTAADARTRALQALSQGGGMAGQAEEADFGRAARVAESRDAMARFNAQQAQQANLYNAGLAQQAFQNRMALADRRADTVYAKADVAGQKADRRRRLGYGIAGGARDAALAYYGGGGGQ